MYSGQKKKHYHIKKAPVIIAIILLVGVTISIIAINSVFQNKKNADNATNVNNVVNKSSLPISSISVKVPPSSDDVSSSDEVSSSDDVSSSDEVSSKTPSSKTPSSKAPSSKTPSSKTPSSLDDTDNPSSQITETIEGELPQGKTSDWNLILLNHDENNKIDAELNITKTKFDSQYVDERAAEAYKNMCAAAQDSNITLFLRSGYRSMNTQRVNYNANVQRELDRGNSQEDAIKLTNLYYTVPGHSEHHTGLAFDILTPQYHKNVYTLDERFADTDAYTWLTQNCAKYGFILRYPKEKFDVTKINFEPWHYRYVGVEHAKYITENSLCLEEYIALLAQREAA